jgi:hypothetical protein
MKSLNLPVAHAAGTEMVGGRVIAVRTSTAKATAPGGAGGFVGVFVVQLQNAATGDEVPRFIGVYSCRESAAAAVARLAQAMSCTLEGFSIDEYDLDRYADVQVPEPLTDDGLWDIRGRAAAATPGPWRAYLEGRDTTVHSHIQTGVADRRGPDLELQGASAADYDFIAHARDDVPRLLETVLELQRQLAERRAA